MLKPKAVAELHLDSVDKFVPFLAVGYSFSRIRTTIDGVEPMDASESFGGVNLNLGMSYNFLKNIFAQLQYDYVRLNRDDFGIDEGFAKNIALIKLGVGFSTNHLRMHYFFEVLKYSLKGIKSKSFNSN